MEIEKRCSLKDILSADGIGSTIHVCKSSIDAGKYVAVLLKKNLIVAAGPGLEKYYGTSSTTGRIAPDDRWNSKGGYFLRLQNTQTLKMDNVCYWEAMDDNVQKVICITSRPGVYLISVGETYYLDKQSIYGDSDGDWYAEIYQDADKTKYVGRVNMRHFHSIS